MLAVSFHTSSDPSDIVRAFWSSTSGTSDTSSDQEERERDKKLGELVLSAVGEFEGIDSASKSRPSSEQIGKLAGDVQSIWRVMVAFYKCVAVFSSCKICVLNQSNGGVDE